MKLYRLYLPAIAMLVCLTNGVMAGSEGEINTENYFSPSNQTDEQIRCSVQIAEKNPAPCHQVPITCTNNSDCKCSGCCAKLEGSDMSVCQFSCQAHHELRINRAQVVHGQ